MSFFTEKITQIVQRPGEDPTSKEDVPWWLKYTGRGLGTVGSFIAIFLGILNCTHLLLVDISCFLSGALQIVIAFIVICCEAPCCCMFIDHVQKVSEMVDSRPYWNRAAAYCLLSIVPIIFCPGISSILGSGLIFATGIVYGMMALGRKASAEEMRAAAAMDAPQLSKQPVSMRDNLVTNAQPIAHARPIGFMPSPFDSNV